MKTKTDLLIEYAELSWNHDFPNEIEIALENDYVANKELYSEEVLQGLRLHLLLDRDASPQDVLNAVRNMQPDSDSD